MKKIFKKQYKIGDVVIITKEYDDAPGLHQIVFNNDLCMIKKIDSDKKIALLEILEPTKEQPESVWMKLGSFVHV